nr:MAG TPA: hypothetical protein [Caudoviricetes sp.]DAW00660.1 MAG TPA: hypothetical protein [Caudoviricetes sp.]DAW02090.1 MAG TPA: hypothetical protein [Caudoviricetes sp.]
MGAVGAAAVTTTAAEAANGNNYGQSPNLYPSSRYRLAVAAITHA